MSRTGFLVVGALIFALAAAGVLVWTNTVQLPGSTPSSSPGPAAPIVEPGEAAYMTLVNEIARKGFVATFTENSATKWQITDGHRLERFWLKEPEIVMARLSSALPRRDDMLLQGLSIELPMTLAQQLNGKRIEVGLLARTPQANGASDVSVVYATRQAGNSGWQTLGLSSQFELRSFKFDVPNIAEGYTAQPMLVIHADRLGQGRAVELLGVYVKEAD